MSLPSVVHTVPASLRENDMIILIIDALRMCKETKIIYAILKLGVENKR